MPSRGVPQRQVSKAAAGLHLGACMRKQHASNLEIPFPHMATFMERDLLIFLWHTVSQCFALGLEIASKIN